MLLAEGIHDPFFLVPPLTLALPGLYISCQLLYRFLELRCCQVLKVPVGFDMLLVVLVVAPAYSAVSMSAPWLGVALNRRK